MHVLLVSWIALALKCNVMFTSCAYTAHTSGLQAQVLLTPWDGRSVFHLAAEKVQPGMLRRLLPLVTAQQLEALPDSQGNNALHAAASSGCAESVALLLEKGMYVDSPGEP